MSEKFKILIIPKTNVTTEIAGNIIGLDFFCTLYYIHVLHTSLYNFITQKPHITVIGT